MFESDGYMSPAAVLNVVSAVAMGVGLCMRFLFPYLSIIECLAAAAPIGLTLSAWIS